MICAVASQSFFAEISWDGKCKIGAAVLYSKAGAPDELARLFSFDPLVTDKVCLMVQAGSLQQLCRTCIPRVTTPMMKAAVAFC